MHDVALAKITPPRYGRGIERTRLLARLDSARERAVVWLEAPPGAGKTNLVTSYLKTRDLRCLWYRIDPTDQDIGSFFHHLSLAARMTCGEAELSLPRFGPEVAGRGEVFTRSYFRRLFERIPTRIVVFDDYQEVGEESPLHEVIAIGMSEMPVGCHAIVLSRSPPPKEYARLQSMRSIELLDSRSFLLSEDETTALCRAFGEAHGFEISRQTCTDLHRRCGGWMTGLVLILEARRTRDFALDRTDDAVPAVIFDYFASEILSESDSETERILLCTALLDEISADLAATLSGVGDAARRLDALSQRGYFTVRHDGVTTTWSYHQLFRQFLTRQAERQLGVDGWRSLQTRTARELVAAGRVEEAIELLRHLGDWQGIVPLLASHASLLLAQGRHQSVIRWIDDAPTSVLERTPWLLYWSAAARMILDPSIAKEGFEKAFRLFLAEGDIRGTFLAWAMSVQNIFFEQSNYRAFDDKVEELEPLLKRFALPDEETEAIVFASLAMCVLWHSLDHPSRDQWIDRALELEPRLPDLGSRIHFLALAHSAFIFSGEAERRERVLEVLRSLEQALPPTSSAALVFKAVHALDCWTRADFEASIAAVEESVAAAEATGAGVMVPLALSAGAACALSLGDRELLEHYVAKMDQTADPRRRHDYSYAQESRGLVAGVDGDWHSARRWAERAGNTLEPLGVPVYSALCDLLECLACHYVGDDEASASLLARARERVGSHWRYILYGAAMTEAEIALNLGDRESARRALSYAFATGRELDFWSFAGWRRDALSRLCAEALAAGIDPPYALGLIEKHRLLPPDIGTTDLVNWPWPIAVRSMGGFELSRSGDRVEFPGKMPRKPLQLLELLVIRGGEQVPEDWLADQLWPDAEGDAAIRSLSTTILRLRRLLVTDGLLVRRNRCLTLDRQRCWVDVWALEDALRALPALEEAASIVAAADRVMSLYRGSFLPQSALPATVSFREQLLRRTFERLESAVQRVEAAGDFERASALRERIEDLRVRTSHDV